MKRETKKVLAEIILVLLIASYNKMFIFAFLWVFLHEVTHILVALRYGCKFHNISFHIFGLNAELAEINTLKDNDKIKVYISGALFNIITALTFYIISFRYNNSFVFTIPVYSNMENMYVLPSPNNPNNYLRELKINGSSVTGFDGAITSYDVYVSSSTSSVSLSAKTVNGGAKISGNISGTGSASGNINVNEGDNSIKVVVTALNGSVKTYTVNVHREKAKVSNPTVEPTPSVDPTPNAGGNGNNGSSVDLKSLVSKSGYKINNSYISGIGINTKASSIVNSFKKNDANVNVVVKNSSGKVIESDYVGTGSIIELSEGSSSLKLTIVIYGDASGDGKINSLDLLKVQKHILGINKLNGSYSVAGDPSGDGKINSLDLLKIQKHILGINLIKQ